MKFFDAMHEGLRRAEAGVERTRGSRYSPQTMWQNLSEGFRRLSDRLGQGDAGAVLSVAGAVILLLVFGPVLLPLVLGLAVVGLLVLFARAWGREFFTLMRLDDGSFPGRFDKLLWGLLLILAPPVGVWAFGSFRRAHWGETKAGQPEFDV